MCRFVPFDFGRQSSRGMRPDRQERLDRECLIVDNNRGHAACRLARSDDVKRPFDGDAKPRVRESNGKGMGRARPVDAATDDYQQIVAELLELRGEGRRVGQ